MPLYKSSTPLIPCWSIESYLGGQNGDAGVAIAVEQFRKRFGISILALIQSPGIV
jgi:hypothetical protein